MVYAECVINAPCIDPTNKVLPSLTTSVPASCLLLMKGTLTSNSCTSL